MSIQSTSKKLAGKQTMFLFVLAALTMFRVAVFAQSYTYTPESFEENIWVNAPASFNDIVSSTGKWTVAKNNIQSTAVAAFDGQYCLVIATKNSALMTPRLDNGAGKLTYHVLKTGSRTINVETSTDGSTWKNIESFVALSVWTERTVNINDPEVRYIRFWSNSNGGLYLDKISVTSAGAPGVTVTTLDPDLITQTSAIVKGTFETDGTSTITACGLCYNDTGYPDINSDKIEATKNTGQFSGKISGLKMGTTYYVKAYVQTNSGISYGLVVPFTTRSADAPLDYWTQPFNDNAHFPSSQPTSPLTINVPGQGDWIYLNAYKSTNPLYITDGSASNLRLIKSGSYVISPVLDAGVSEISFVEGRGGRELSIYTSTNSGASWTLLQKSVSVKTELIVGKVNSALVNRIKIANESGSDADIDNITITVYPSGEVPTLTTTAVTQIAKNSAVSGGTITNEGSKPVVERGLCWSTITTPIIADNKIVAGEGSGSFTATLSDLPAGTLIYLRAYATSRAGTGYGNEITFTTVSPTLPIIETIEATEVKGELAFVGGTISDDGGASVLKRGICWNTTGNPGISDSFSDDGSGTGQYVSKMEPLEPSTTYFYRAYATNNAGTAYGSEKTLTTTSVSLPEVRTVEALSIYFYKAEIRGSVINDGNAITIRGICWNTTGEPTLADDTIQCGTGSGSYSGFINGLAENTLYYARAFAINSQGTVYGNTISFATPFSDKLSKPIGFAEGTTGGGTPTHENTVTVTTAHELSAAINGTKSVILISGTISTPRISATIKNKSIIGLPGARLINLDQTSSGSGILYLGEGSNNIIIQNLCFEGPGAYDTDGYDLLTNKGCYNLWVDHCEFQDGCDGNFDNTGNSDNITVSWCKFTYLKPPRAGGSGGSADHRFSNLVGGSDSDYPTDGHYSITWQNCWWTKGVVARMIRGRNTEVHMLNCYWNSPETDDAIGLTAGTNGSTVYVEGGVFDIPDKANVVDIGSGSIAVNFVNCIGKIKNYGTVSSPDYEYRIMPVEEVVAAVAHPVCGAGATLMVSASGEVFSGCPATPILSVTGNPVQEVFTGNPISPIVFTWGGTATDVVVSDLPAGLTADKNTSSKTLTISGTPIISGTFTVSTIGGNGLPIAKHATITLTSVQPATLTYIGKLEQTVQTGSPISQIVFTWGGGATDVATYGLPAGLNAAKNTIAKTLTISGIPTTTSTFTVTTIGGSGEAVSIQGSVSILFGDKKFKIAYVTNPAVSTYMNDIKILPALKADPNFEVSEVNTANAGNDYSNYDLIIFSEVAGSADPGVAELKGIDKPFIMMKVHAYKSDAGSWNWSSSSTAYGQNASETNLAVTQKNHPMFKDVNWINDNEVNVLTAVGSAKGLTYMNPSNLKSVSGGTVSSLAIVKGQTVQVSVFEIPAGTSVAGTLIKKNFIQIGINSSSYANVTDDGVSMVKNACFYLLGVFTSKQQLEQLASIENFMCSPTFIGSEVLVKFDARNSGSATIILSDISGRNVFQMQVQYLQGNNMLTMDLKHLKKGIYLVTLATNRGNFTQKTNKEIGLISVIRSKNQGL